jgi:hypothetical protein
MSEVWDGWRTIPDHAARAFVNVLRRGHVPVRGEAMDRETLRPVRFEDVAAGLLSVAAGFAEYEAAALSPGYRLGSFEHPPQQIAAMKTVDLVGAELAWEEFRDDLIRFELPAGVTPNPDPAHGDQDPKPGKRGATEAAVPEGKKPATEGSSSLTRKKKAAYRRRVKEFRKRNSVPPYQTNKDGVQGDLQWAVKNGVRRPDIVAWRRELLDKRAPGRGRPRNSTTK